MSPLDLSHQTVPFPKNRRPVLETLRVWAIRHPIHGLLEVDVTTPRRLIHERRARTGEDLSFTAFLIACVGQAVAENRAVHALRSGRNQLVLFDQVDVTTVVEVTTGEAKFPVTHIVRSANSKTVEDITGEIRAVQARPRQDRRPRSRGARRLFSLLPAPLRRLVYRRLARNPAWFKRNVGTVGLTAVGMFGRRGGWGIPVAVTPLFVTVGSIAQKPGIVDGQIEIRDVLSLTLTFDHDLVDGAPAARLAARLQELIESGAGLDGPGNAHG